MPCISRLDLPHITAVATYLGPNQLVKTTAYAEDWFQPMASY